MKALVTGGAGFIGSHVVDRLLQDGLEVVVVDNFSTGSRDNLAQHNSLNVYERDICNDIGAVFADNNIDVVFHLAAYASVQRSINHPTETHKVNVDATLHLLQLCHKHGVKRFVFSSSAAIYGDQNTLPSSEALPAKPLSPYGLHKLIGEQYCELFHRMYGMETVSLRYFNVYGPRQNPDGEYACVIPKFISLVRDGTAPRIYGDGRQTRDFVYVSDVASANIAAATTKNKECFGKTFNIGSGTRTFVNDLTSQIITLSGARLAPVHAEPANEIQHSQADITRAKQLLGWKPAVAFEEGVRKTYDFFA